MVFGKGNNRFTKKVEAPTGNVETPAVLPITEEPVDLNSTGFSMIQHPEGGFALVTLKFNPVTMLAKVEEVKKVSESRMAAEDAFRMAVGQYFGEQEAKS